MVGHNLAPSKVLGSILTDCFRKGLRSQVVSRVPGAAQSCAGNSFQRSLEDSAAKGGARNLSEEMRGRLEPTRPRLRHPAPPPPPPLSPRSPLAPLAVLAQAVDA
eukprot:9483733-Pyramimonas_sp.AAC.1